MIASLLLSYVYFPWFFATPSVSIANSVTCVTFSTPALIYVNVKICLSIKDLCLILFLYDNILLAYIGGLVGLVGMTYQYMGPNAPSYMVVVVAIICLDIFLLSGPYRMAISRYKWKKYHVIVAKVVIGCCIFSFLFIGAYFMVNDF